MKEDRGKKGNNSETYGQDNFFEKFEQEDFETVGQEDSVPPAPPKISHQKVVLLHVISKLGVKSRRKRKCRFEEFNKGILTAGMRW